MNLFKSIIYGIGVLLAIALTIAVTYASVIVAIPILAIGAFYIYFKIQKLGEDNE